MRKAGSLTKSELVGLMEDIADEIKNNEGAGIARLLADARLITEAEYEDAVNF